MAEWRDGFFIHDKWQATRKLTLTLGLRYELPTVPYSVNGNATILNAAQTALIPPNAPVKGFPLHRSDHKDFAPRVGIAYRVTEKTVVRGGFGIYYNPNQTNSFTLANTNPPFATQTSFTSSPATPQFTYANPLGTTGPAGLTNAFTLNPNLPTPRMNQWSFGVDRKRWKGAGLEVSYLGSHQYHLDRSFYNNTPQPGPGAVNPRDGRTRCSLLSGPFRMTDRELRRPECGGSATAGAQSDVSRKLYVVAHARCLERFKQRRSADESLQLACRLRQRELGHSPSFP